MRFAVEFQGVPIGHSDLQHTDTSMGVASGRFVPSPAYQDVQAVFLKFAGGLYADYFKSRDALGLSLRHSGGDLVPTACIHIVDFSVQLAAEDIELEILLVDHSAWSELRAGATRA